jgi:hypothetical protein
MEGDKRRRANEPYPIDINNTKVEMRITYIGGVSIFSNIYTHAR